METWGPVSRRGGGFFLGPRVAARMAQFSVGRDTISVRPPAPGCRARKPLIPFRAASIAISIPRHVPDTWSARSTADRSTLSWGAPIKAAWLMATCPDSKFRNEKLALEAARKSCSSSMVTRTICTWKPWRRLRPMPAMCTDEAAETQAKVVQLAPSGEMVRYGVPGGLQKGPALPGKAASDRHEYGLSSCTGNTSAREAPRRR